MPYTIPPIILNPETHRDIIEFFEGIPRGKKASTIRNAIRHYIESGEDEVNDVPALTEVLKHLVGLANRLDRLERSIQEIKHDLLHGIVVQQVQPEIVTESELDQEMQEALDALDSLGSE